MLRKASEAISEGNGPIPRQEEFGSGQPTLADAFREMKEKLEEFHDDMTGLVQGPGQVTVRQHSCYSFRRVTRR